MNDIGRKYIYVDGYYEDIHGKRISWIRFQHTKTREFITDPALNYNCYASAQYFAESNRHAAPEPEPNEAYDEDLPDKQSHYHGLYFDFDSKPKDDDINKEAPLERSRADAVKLCDWFHKAFPDISESSVQAWFSGQKGFHVTVRPEIFGIKPHRHLTYIVKTVAQELKDKLDLQTLDMSVYTISRCWRIPNTIHPGTGKFKIELAIDDLKWWKIGEIVSRAAGPRNETGTKLILPNSHIYEDIEYDLLADKEAEAWWLQFTDLYDIRNRMKQLRPRAPIQMPLDGEYPVCIKDMLENGPKPTGPNRNRVLLPIVGFCRDAGMSKESAASLVDGWTRDFYPDPSMLNERLSNGKSVVNSGYGFSKLQFSCRAIRANGGTGSDERVACVGSEKCPWIKESADQDPIEMPTVHLADATKGCYMNAKVRMPIHITAIAGHPYDIPVKGRCVCQMDAGKMCNNCPSSEAGGTLDFKYTTEKDEVLDLINITKVQRKAAIKAKCKIPSKCFKVEIEELEHAPLEELQIIPMVDYTHLHEDDGEIAKGQKHVVRKAFHLGHGIETNKKYIVEALVCASPKNQQICFLFDKLETAQNDIDEFTMTDEMMENLKTFQPSDGQSVKDKFLDIHRDLTANVHQIGGRFDLSIAIDLSYHSMIGFRFAGKMIRKGWFETLVVGDSGSGKAQRVSDQILTPTGWTTFGEVKVGDAVIGSDGKSHQVTGVYPRGKLQTYRVGFRDGTSAVAAGDHLWSVGNINWERDGHEWKVRTTDELIKSGLFWKASGAKCNPEGIAKYWIPTVKPVEFAHPGSLPPIDPWALGVLLGDGGFTDTTPRITNPETDLTDRLAQRLPDGDKLLSKPLPSNGCPYFTVVGMNTRYALDDLGFGKDKSEGKFIPDRYLWGTIEERLAILQGLCDTDGSVGSTGTSVEFSTVSPQLAKDVVFLVQSLGGLAKLTTKTPTFDYKGEKREGQLAYRIMIYMPPGMVPVTTDKHIAKWKGKEKRYHKRITSIEPEGEEECICIKVDAPDELYITNDFIVTHNSTMIERIMEHFGLGEMMGGEDSKRTTLVYVSIQIQGQWVLKWGKLPQADRRLLVIDEFSGIPQEEVSKMTQLRSEGKARGGGVNAEHETWARTRLVFLTNPFEGDDEIASYNYGVKAVSGLFKDLADTRRVDVALIAEKGEVDKTEIHRRWDKEDYPHRYTSDLCRNLILWAWSREPKHVEWEGNTEDVVTEFAGNIGDTYSCDIPLVTTADMRLKLARVSCAVAARLFSTDAKGQKLIVKQEHVEFAAWFIDGCYRKESMGYFDYALQYKKDNFLPKEKKEEVKDQLEYYEHDDKNILKTLLDVQLLSKPALTDMTLLNDEDLKKLWRYLISQRLIKRVARGYRKTSAFNMLLRSMTRKDGERGFGGDFMKGGDFVTTTNGHNVQIEMLDPSEIPIPADPFMDSPFYEDDEPYGDKDEVPF